MNLASLLATSASRLPDKPALIFRGQPTSYRELDDRVARAAGALGGLGLAPTVDASPGDRVGLMVGNTPHFIEAFFAILRAGCVAVPLNTGFTRGEVAYILEDAGARGLVVAEPFLSVVEGLDEEIASLEHVIVAGASTPPERLPMWRGLIAEAEPADVVDVDGDAVAVLQYTSGTTGRPKGAMLSHANLLANHRQMAQTRLKVEERDIILCVLPTFHIYALNVAMAFTLARGATILLIERFDPVETLRDIERHRATVIIGAPPMYVAWANTPGVDEFDLQSVRYAVSGAAPLPAQALERFSEDLGIPIWEGYGLTETSPVLTTMAMSDRIKPGSVGRPVPDVEIRLVDDGGEPVRQGDPGELVVRGPNVFAGYWEKPEETKEVLDGGWFHTGDIGVADDDGDIHLVDRKQDLIIVSGFNVYPREVEEVLFGHPKIAQAAIVGTPHPYTGESVKAVVVLAEDAEATADEIIEFARQRLARFKVPEVVEFVEELPLLPSGKVRRRALREQA